MLASCLLSSYLCTMQNYLIRNIAVVNEGTTTVQDVWIKDGRIEKMAPNITVTGNYTEINGEGKHLLPGVIDDQVHFREPGLTQKATIYTEARAAVAGGTTTFMEMPNTKPAALTQELLEDKYNIAKQHSLANYSFFMGVANDNAEEVLKTNAKKDIVCGIKIFMGSSTGNMLVDNYLTLEKIFGNTELLIATHCEDEKIIRQNMETFTKEKGAENLTAADHPLIRNVEACFESSLVAIQFAQKHNARLHILHISTGRELQLFSNMLPLAEKRITNEVCVHHLHFTADDYARYGNLIKCNPAIKSADNRDALWQGLLDDRLDIIATDHAPHTWEEKQQAYVQAPSGVPLVQHSLLLMLEYVKKGKLTLEQLVNKMSHAPAICFQIRERGFLREGYFADCVIVDLAGNSTVEKQNIYYKCGWSPFEGHTFPAAVTHTFVSGHLAYENGTFNESVQGQRLTFNR
ncbi:dihydroorotase [Chitinophaga terrae (ex Kim and Jung 2007)]|uniref:Dihydroorotase n=2 Tax=Chitinophaga terrae (ex Kim and Jung 2007) TaxID=408074 RepID=A0A1H4DQD2_9BACT|nr:dihydroorotase [Chitinophaga terrae (ex Kim and Jung 2007)]